MKLRIEVTGGLPESEVDGHQYDSDENAPTLTVKGDLSLGNVEVKRIR